MQSSSSKVICEYYDPSALFPLVSKHLSEKLPLRNLHWKSPTRPLRSIDSLHVEFVPSPEQIGDGTQTPSGSANDVPTSQRPSEPATSVGKERRHQIPGLRQTPYLKLYLLRCDEGDTYKSTSRKQLRDWLKSHTPPSQSSSKPNSQENHDAFEWLILHVVLPDTAAAAQPRFSGSSSSTGNSTPPLERSSSGTRWPGRGSSTIFEKIRSDFNSSSKSAPDRVAQIRLKRDDVPPPNVPPSAASGPPISESPQEQLNAWNDLISKLKTLILLSFDQRVSQYEEDIREKDSQRSLPGWNFCTFFVLKEGLARGFESVGLVEDALVGYDELSIGLDTIVREQAEGASEGHGGSFLEHTEDLKDLLKATSEEDHPSKPINDTKKNYRELILSNNISIFDFRCYIFSRQMTLLLRLGNAQSARTQLAGIQSGPLTTKRRASFDGGANLSTFDLTSGDNHEDFVSLAELCQRSLSFLTMIARILREDMRICAESRSEPVSDAVLDNVIASWCYRLAQQVLDETAVPAVSDQGSKFAASPKKMPSSPRGSELNLPARSSSLASRRTSVADFPYNQPPPSGQVVFDRGKFNPYPPSPLAPNAPGARSGLQELAAHRAELYLIERKIVERLAGLRKWTVGWSMFDSKQSKTDSTLSDVNLDEDSEPQSESEDVEKHEDSNDSDYSSEGLSSSGLSKASSSLDDFRSAYEVLSDAAVRHYLISGRTRSAERLMGDLAVLKFDMGDYAAAATFFGRVGTVYAEQKWNQVETAMLRMHAQCLKELHRKDEYIRVLLQLLAKSAARAKSKIDLRVRLPSAAADESENPRDLYRWLDDDSINTDGVLNELVTFSDELPYDIPTPMLDYFADVVVEPFIRHFDDRDGFMFRLRFRHLLDDDLVIDQARVRLVSTSPGQNREIWVESNEPCTVKQGVTKVWLKSNVTTFGAYVVERIVLKARKISFQLEPFLKPDATTPLGLSSSTAPILTAKKSKVLCYPRNESFNTKVSLCTFIHIDKIRSVQIECESGWNDIEKLEIQVRSASAGLRLHTGEATLQKGDARMEVPKKLRPGALELKGLARDSRVKIQIPYDLESTMSEIQVRLDITYQTASGSFHYLSQSTIPIDLPLDVNVQDLFKASALFSRFSIRTPNQKPLRLLDVTLSGTDEFAVRSPPGRISPLVVFPKQPASVLYKITKRKSAKSNKKTSEPLALKVVYQCLDDQVTDTLESSFMAALRESPIEHLARLLLPVLVERVLQRVATGDADHIALKGTVPVGSYDDLKWADITENLPEPTKGDVVSWLQKWHEGNSELPLPLATAPAEDSSQTSRNIVITVAVPKIQVVQTASLKILGHEEQTGCIQPVIPVGEMLMAELSVIHTRKWGDKSSLVKESKAIESEDDPLDCMYEIDANPDIWLIGGQRRAHFSAQEDELKAFPVMLMPLRPGHLLLPTVEVRYAPARKRPQSQSSAWTAGAALDAKSSAREKEKEAQGEEGEVTCETDYQSVSETVLVVPSVKSTTIGLEKSRLNGIEAHLIGSEGSEVDTGV
ncbi:hypothetical protein K402DRAFT_424748 [Aulographum hederae CBS 113979]|uniref:TMEM1 family protein-like protein n=1 Tax=Aulographum hederae CBS 113979 TaxID=1176131 RepID=A0A6G1GML0_9PEZI|nr:hypothetical protein K402DRAFT_424748 [Aulographum hederae CBS 113979]